jgi:hypothetical protein
VTGHIRDAALVDGTAAVIIAAVLKRHLPAYLAALPVPVRRDVDQALDALQRAAAAHRSASGKTETPSTPVDAGSDQQGLTTAEAAQMLGVGERRARQLAAAGLGRKVGPVWLLDPTAVQARQAAAQRGDDT